MPLELCFVFGRSSERMPGVGTNSESACTVADNYVLYTEQKLW